MILHPDRLATARAHAHGMVTQIVRLMFTTSILRFTRVTLLFATYVFLYRMSNKANASDKAASGAQREPLESDIDTSDTVVPVGLCQVERWNRDEAQQHQRSHGLLSQDFFIHGPIRFATR